MKTYTVLRKTNKLRFVVARIDNVKPNELAAAKANIMDCSYYLSAGADIVQVIEHPSGLIVDI